MDRHDHWQRVWAAKGGRGVSWFEDYPTVSIQMMEAAGLAKASCVLDVGGGDSSLIDVLVARGLTCLAVLDVSEAALDRARHRLGNAATIPTWIAADITGEWSLDPVDIWHDRASFHFLTQAADRARYLARLRQVLKPGGSAVIATFALDGPESCSGLPVARYSPETLATEFGADFTLVEARSHQHTTPGGSTQSFQYSRLRRELPARRAMTLASDSRP